MIYVLFATQLACHYKMILKVWCCADSLAILDEVSKAREKRHAEVEQLLRKMAEVTTLDTKITRALQPLWQPVVGPTFFDFFVALYRRRVKRCEKHGFLGGDRCRGQTLSHTTTFWWTVPGHLMQSWLTFRSDNLSRVEQNPCVSIFIAQIDQLTGVLMRRARHLELLLKTRTKNSKRWSHDGSISIFAAGTASNYGKTLETQSCRLQVETVILSQGILMHCQG